MSRTDAILKRILTLHPNKLIDLKLDRIERLLDRLGHPERRLPPTIHVAGTNGKGSTIAFLRAMLEASGQKVHVYTSPHLVAFRERIRLAGTLVSPRRLIGALERCEAANKGEPITYFELTTAAAILLFSEVPADYLLLEVGLGGRFDATNVLTHPLGTIITPIAFDHQDFLGPTLDSIAREKAGILKPGAPAVVARQADEAQAAIADEAGRLGVVPFWGGRDFDAFAQRGRLVFQDEKGLLDLPLPSLAGPFQIDNAGVAIAAARHFGLPVTNDELSEGLRAARWPARLMPITTGKLRALLPKTAELWVDGGHNPAGAAALAEALAEMDRTSKKPLILIMGLFANKDAQGVLGPFNELGAEILTVPISGSRAAHKPGDLARLAREQGFAANPKRSLGAALATAATQRPNARVVVCGSLHLAGHFLKLNGTPPN